MFTKRKAPSFRRRSSGFAAPSSSPQAYIAGGNVLVCHACDHDRFRTAPGVGPLGMHLLVCERCHRVEIFQHLPELITDTTVHD